MKKSSAASSPGNNSPAERTTEHSEHTEESQDRGGESPGRETHAISQSPIASFRVLRVFRGPPQVTHTLNFALPHGLAPRILRLMKRATCLLLLASSCAFVFQAHSLLAGGLLEDLAKPIEGRSMRASSTFRAGKDGKYDPNAPPEGDDKERSNFDNFRVPPGKTHVLLDAKGPGVITHIWITFLGPEPQPWAKNGSANHQEMLLRMFWDGNPRPAVEAPVGDFFANCFGKRIQVISLPVVV